MNGLVGVSRSLAGSYLKENGRKQECPLDLEGKIDSRKLYD